MIIQQVRFENFGVYGGSQTIDLALTPDNLYDRPIILFHGKNGVGKTSFVEGLRVALHGSLALGDRVSQRAYQEHLKRRIHRPANPNASRPTSASVTVIFDLVRESNTHRYTVTRKWQLTGNGLSEVVDVLEDDQLPLDVAPENYDAFLRDLVSPSAGELFFFDGERIDRLTDQDGADATLADAVQRLLGLHLVQQLEADLDVYIGRTAGRMGQQELQALQEEYEGLETTVADHKLEYSDCEQQIREIQATIVRQEQELADKGGTYAKEYPRLQKNRIRLKQEVEAARRRMQDAASGLLPLAAAPKMADLILRRLDLEAQQHQQQIVEKLLDRRRIELLSRLSSVKSGKADTASLNDTQLAELVSVINSVMTLEDTVVIEPAEIFIQVSERERSSMIGQFEEALGSVATSFHEMANSLDELEAELEKTERELLMAPSDIILQPIFDVIQLLDKQLTQCRDKQQRTIEYLAAATFKLEQSNIKVRRAKDALKEGQRVDLAVRAQRAIRAYAVKLRAKKLEVLQADIVNRFNSLCRKGAFLSSAHIDAETFAITLERNGEQFNRNMLSAGEKQLFALSILWALREVAGLPMPVIIDTPLGRLDSDHRLAMLRKFLPEVAHQVILLATDTEIDETVIGELAPAVSHGYSMVFNPETGSTQVKPLDLDTMVLTKAEIYNN